MLKRLAGCRIKNKRPIFKIEISLYQLKADLTEKILFGKITHLLNSKLRKTLVRAYTEKRIPHSILIQANLIGVTDFSQKRL